MLSVNVITPAPRDEWQEIAKQSPDTVLFQTPEWVDCICAVDGPEDATRLYEFSDGVRMVAPMVRRRYLGGALATQASLPPNWGFGGLLGPQRPTPQHTAAVFADLARQKEVQTYIWPNPLHGGVWEAGRSGRVIAIPRLSHVLDLTGGFDAVWEKRYTTETRSHVRKAQRSRLEVESDTAGRLMPAFYQLFSLSIERWAKQQHEPAPMARWRARRRDSLRKFQHVAKSLGAACKVWIASMDGMPAAGIVIVLSANAVYMWGAMDKERVGNTHANELLHTLAIEEACRTGCHYYHMGESGASKPLAHFKERFGARPFAYSEHRVERLPLTRADQLVRGLGKRLVGFKDA